jgi:hypothetical protein
MAFNTHENVCRQWRLQSRPKDANHPAKIANLQSQRNLQHISGEEESLKAHKNHEDLMSTFKQDISQVCQKLKKIRGEKIINVNINGVDSGNNGLEGFCSNTEDLCNDESETSIMNFTKNVSRII